MLNILLGSYAFMVFCAIGLIRGAAHFAKIERLAFDERMHVKGDERYGRCD
jgi:hypothetical protein